jgi:DnaJ like chaperone protein
MNFPLLFMDPITEWPAWIVATLFFGPLVTGAFIYFYYTRHARSWRKGIFPISLKPTDDNLLEAYLALASKLMLINPKSLKGKTQFINEYFNRYFRLANYNFGDSLVFSLNYPINEETVTNWINSNWENDSMRIQLIYFLVGLAIQTDKLSNRELIFLQAVNSKLGFNTESLNRIIAIYTSYYEEKQHQEKSTVSSPKSILSYLAILGLNENYDRSELKSAYRKMAKLHHPDNYSTESEAQQKIASEKFIQIQKAYEFLLNKISL